MFRSPKYCDRYEEIPIQLDTPITTPGAGVAQRKNGYQFTINDRYSYFDWFNAYFEVDFPFGFEGRMWDLIVSVPDHCLSFYFSRRFKMRMLNI